MSAVPQKKLCWNCEGNVAKDIDNCPYCGVYLHAAEIEENSIWNPAYRPKIDEKNIPSPLYQIQSESHRDDDLDPEEQLESSLLSDESKSIKLNDVLSQLKHDVFPILFLMMGSIFFLFGVVLLLFSQNGTLTLQWQESDGIYFLALALPLVGFGWMYFHRLDSHD